MLLDYTTLWLVSRCWGQEVRFFLRHRAVAFGHFTTQLRTSRDVVSYILEKDPGQACEIVECESQVLVLAAASGDGKVLEESLGF
jgi:hypothetical protein